MPTNIDYETTPTSASRPAQPKIRLPRAMSVAEPKTEAEFRDAVGRTPEDSTDYDLRMEIDGEGVQLFRLFRHEYVQLKEHLLAIREEESGRAPAEGQRAEQSDAEIDIRPDSQRSKDLLWTTSVYDLRNPEDET